MKVEYKTKPVAFQPVTLAITIESRKELDEFMEEVGGLCAGCTWPLFQALKEIQASAGK